MSPRRPSAEEVAIYDRAIAHLFRSKRAKLVRDGVHPISGLIERIDFEKRELELLIDTLAEHRRPRIRRKVKNVADIKYTYDARKEFPPAIKRCGDWVILGRGKGKYSFVRTNRPNLIDPVALATSGEVEFVPHDIMDETPAYIGPVLAVDEQGMMARVRHNGVIRHFLGLLSAQQVQAHVRTTVNPPPSLLAGHSARASDRSQIEVDEVYVGQDGQGVKQVIPITAKADADYLSFTQALNLSLFVASEPKYAGFRGRPVGAYFDRANALVYLVEFSFALEIGQIAIERIHRYRFRP